uniref:DNA mismatch repair proteins mutS family domain-containing protein n=1 Tax=Kalanchoe fedtschenkoi TaxID=63787 RepID=A0A7N0V7I2_KALFE
MTRRCRGEDESAKLDIQIKLDKVKKVVSIRDEGLIVDYLMTTICDLSSIKVGPDAVHLLAIKEGCGDLESGSNIYGFAFVDCATMKFFVGSITDDASFAALGALLMQVSPKEIIYEIPGLSRETQKALKKYSVIGTGPMEMTPVLPCTDFSDASVVRNQIKSKGYFKGTGDSWDHVLDGVGHPDDALTALGGLINHLSRLMLNDTLCKGDIFPYQVYTGSLRMDRQTLINLEIFSNSADGGSSGTLYKYLNQCITYSGKRLLRNWICHPLRDIEGINDRLDVVEDIMKHSEIVVHVGQQLRKLPDLERLLGRIKGSADSSASLILPLIGKKILKQRVKAFGSLVKGLRIGMDLLMLLQQDGHLNFQFFKFLNMRMLSGTDGLDKYLTQFEAAIDSDFPNYQDHDITDSDAETLAILIEMFMEKSSFWCQIMHGICCVDVFRSFAVIGSTSCGSMCRPVLLPSKEDGPTLAMKGLWHPYAVGINGGELPVPNNINLGQSMDGYHPRTLLLTGPNMGGKSTLLRATCLAVVLAQLGAYVPCEMCVFSVVDIIFTRLGASDRIMTGESTFFVECAETASVLQHATQDSLVLLDELGRGTSTFDGYAIAYAVFRHLVEKVNCRLLFATHYHPLTKEFASHPQVTLQH